MNTYELITGVGEIYIAAQGATCPAMGATAGAAWTNLGEFKESVKLTPEQSIAQIRTKNRTGAVKAVRTEEKMTVETVLAEATLENLAQVMGATGPSDTPASTGVIGKRSLNIHRGAAVSEFALLFRGASAYGAYPSQYYMPRGYFDGAAGLEFKQEDSVGIAVKFEALEDLNAATEAERFGYLEMQDAAAT